MHYALIYSLSFFLPLSPSLPLPLPFSLTRALSTIPRPHTHSEVKNGTGTSQKHEGKDVSDKEMAKLMAGNTKRKRD